MNDNKCIRAVYTINPHLENMLQKIAKKEFDVYNINVKEVNADGNNYLGTLNEVVIEGTNGAGYKELHLFVKSTLVGKDSIDILSVTEAFITERNAYIQFAKIYDELQEDANIPQEERYKFAKCYEESNSEIIIMENLVMQGFTTPNRFEVISLDYAELCIKQLAKFHGLSRVFEKRRPNLFNETVKVLNFPIRFNEQWKTFFMNSAETSLTYLEDDAKERLAKIIPELYEKLISILTKCKSKCLCHGDYRTSNILQKIQNGKVIDVMPVDYQMLHYGMPLCDLIYFIFGGTDSEFRKNHLDHLKNLYYNTMSEFLKYFSMDIENVFPRNEFEAIYKNSLELGLIICLWYLHFHLAEDDELPDITNLSSLNLSVNNHRIKSRLRDVVNDFIDWGYL